ncbi:membrane protein [Dyadobacter frigoris]|uniref:DUF4231 domain-containing protein n=1 Tax=Dyadobacter frigoris TaxID=2576211 RepID=UPI0024A085ED|nr:DUF4231 domain-containing protein [Dyadobacter frigoris]GLU51542.1 membrane protein [Dyadobacter frigoris]
MKNKDFPGIQQAADEASNRSQNSYIQLLRANLLTGVIASLIIIYNFERREPKVLIYYMSLGLLIISITLTVIIKYLKFENIWYQGRALAESAKTLTWRYITCSENYESVLQEHVVETSFIEALQAVQRQFPDLISYMDNGIVVQPAITAKMNFLRDFKWQDRLGHYLTFRIQDQINWYSSKAEFNKRKKNFWIWMIILFQVLSVLACICLILWPTTSWNLVGLFTTIAASAIAWLELKQYQTLIQAYTTATMELTLISAISSSINSEQEFSKFVLDSENAISREHTMWLAQRRK